jgi:nucleotide-binding universal stress UspA family protein
MPMKVLAVVAEASTARSCLDAALAVASADPTAEIEAFHVKVDPAHLFNGDEEIALQKMRIKTEGTAEARAAAVRGIYQAWRQRLSLEVSARVTWREVVGAEEASVAREAKGADFLVVGRPHNLDGGGALLAAAFESHRPLLVPPEWMPARVDGFARHMAIAWKPTPQAHRAVEGAGPWLRRAEQVSVVMVAKDLDHAGWPEAERLSRTTGFTATPTLITPGHDKIGDQLVAAATRLHADAMVLGAFRHNAMVEWLLPSTTWQVVRHTRIPIFLAH